jgi:hypothetical protein
MCSKGHFISHKKNVMDVANISLDFSIFVIHLFARHFEGTRILGYDFYSDCKAVIDSLDYKISIVRLRNVRMVEMRLIF